MFSFESRRCSCLMPTLASGVSDEELSDSEHPHFAPMKHDLDTNHDADKLITLLPPPIQNGRRSFESLSTMGSDGHERKGNCLSKRRILSSATVIYCIFLTICGTIAILTPFVSEHFHLWYLDVFSIYVFGTSVICVLFLLILCHSIKSTGQWYFDPHNGSPYLRAGAAAFAFGSILHYVIRLSKNLALFDAKCIHKNVMIFRCLHIILAALFQFLQLFLLLVDTKVCVTRLKALANAALSHLIMSNIYIWLTVIVEEIKESIDFSHFLSSIKNHEEFEGEDCISNYTVLLVELEESASALLYPCTVENALISASFLSIMWSNVGIKKHSSAKVIRHTHIVDFCKHVSFGFMAGFLFCSGSVISMILYITFNGSKFQNKSISIYHAMQAVLLFFMTIAAMTGHLSMRNTHKSKKHHNKMDKPLLLISLFGTFLYCLCSTISGGLVTHKIHTLEFSLLQISTTFSYALYIAQSVIQTIFVLQALRVQAGLNKTFSREFVVFLLMTNLSLWVEFMLEIKEPDINPLQEEFFGRDAWIMLSHLTGPLAIFFRFHSTVCCFDILQYAYRNPAISTYRHSSMMTNKLSL